MLKKREIMFERRVLYPESQPVFLGLPSTAPQGPSLSVLVMDLLSLYIVHSSLYLSSMCAAAAAAAAAASLPFKAEFKPKSSVQPHSFPSSQIIWLFSFDISLAYKFLATVSVECITTFVWYHLSLLT